MHSYYNDFRHLNPEESLTCVIGARGIDGCVIVSDTREVAGSEHRDVSKIRNIWNDKGAIACAGEAPLIGNIVETINGISKNADADKMVKDIIDENVRSVLKTNPPVTTQFPPVPMEKRFEAIFIGLQEFDKGESYIRMIHDEGFSTPIEKFEIIGARSSIYKNAIYTFLRSKVESKRISRSRIFLYCRPHFLTIR